MAELLATRTALRSLTTGDDVDTAIEWFDLRDDTTELRYVPAMAQNLGIPTTELFPGAVEIARKREVPIRKLEALRFDHVDRFSELVAQVQSD